MLSFNASRGCATRMWFFGGWSALLALLLLGCDGRLSSNDAYNEPVDRDAPVVVWYSPTEGAQVQGLVDLQVQVTDDDGPPRVVGFSINGQPLQQLTAPPWSWPWDTGGLPPGRYVLSATATDAGNKNTTADITVELAPREGAGPIVRIVEPRQEYVGAQAELALDARTSDGVPLREVSLHLDDQQFAAISAPPWEYVWDTRAFAEGEHRLWARAVDVLGREAMDEEMIFLDRATPTLAGVELLGRRGGRVRVALDLVDDSPIEGVWVSAPDNEFVLDEGPPWEVRFPLREGDPGTRDLEIRALDAAGNELVTQAQVQLDAQPQVEIVAPSAGARLPPSFPIVAQVSDDTAGWTAQLWVDGELQPSWSPSNPQWVAPRVAADRRLEVVVTDAQGQEARAEVTVRVDPNFVPVAASLLGCEGAQTAPSGCAPISDAPLRVGGPFSVLVKVEGMLEQVRDVSLKMDGQRADQVGGPDRQEGAEYRRYTFDAQALAEGERSLVAQVQTTTGTTWLVYGAVLVDYCDEDGDDHRPQACGGEDCDDAQPLASPSLEEVCGDGLDNDCEGTADVLEGEACP